ncbi:MAG: BON domain-containing protein [Caldilineaceae bacterium]
MPVVRRHLRQGLAANRLVLHRNIPIKTDAKTVGQVDHLLVLRESGKITHIAIRRGLLQREYVLAPIEVFAEGPDDYLVLTAPTVTLDALPHYSYAGEDVVLAAVKQQLCEESTAFDGVQATINDGILTLTGKVASRELKSHAGELAENVPGVTGVQNELTIGQEQSDGVARVAEGNASRWTENWQQGDDRVYDAPADEVVATVNYALAADRRVDGATIVVTNTDGVIALHGTVSSFAERQTAETVAAEQPGVVAVINELTIQRVPVALH